MRYSTSALLAIAATPLLAFAQGQSESNGSNPFNIPPESLNTEAGETVDLTWKPTTDGTVTIYLRSGASNNLNQGVAIASNIDNSGSFTWEVPEDIVRGSNYALEIVDDSDDENTNYTPPFVIESDNNAAPSPSSSSASESASATESSSSSATEEASTETEAATKSSMSESSMSESSMSESSMSMSNTASDATMTSGAAIATQSGMSNSTMTTSAGSSGATSTSDSDSEAQMPEEYEGAASRTTTFVGLIGLVAIGAFAL